MVILLINIDLSLQAKEGREYFVKQNRGSYIFYNVFKYYLYSFHSLRNIVIKGASRPFQLLKA